MPTRSTLAAIAAFAGVALVASCSDPLSPPAAGTPATAVAGSLPAVSLLECPTDETLHAQRTIGLLGGTITAGGTSITIPPGAVLLPRTFHVTVPASRLMEVDISAAGSAHYQFLLPATVTIDYSRCGTAAAVDTPLRAYYIHDITKVLLALMGGTDDKVGRKVTFATDHLSGYAIAN